MFLPKSAKKSLQSRLKRTYFDLTWRPLDLIYSNSFVDVHIESFRLMTETLGYSWPAAIALGTLGMRASWMVVDGVLSVTFI